MRTRAPRRRLRTRNRGNGSTPSWARFRRRWARSCCPTLKTSAEWLKDKNNQDKLDGWIDDFGTFVDLMADLASALKTVADEFAVLFTPLTKAWNALPSWLQNWIKDGHADHPEQHTSQAG